MTIRPLFAWYDMWVGAFWDRKARALYLLPLPCIGIVINLEPAGNRQAEHKHGDHQHDEDQQPKPEFARVV